MHSTWRSMSMMFITLDKIFGVKGGLNRRYNMKDMGEAKFFARA